MENQENIIELRQVLQGHEGEINASDFGPRDRLLATASSDRTVRLWRLNGDQTEYGDPEILRHHSLGVNQVQFSPQGTMLATASSDGTAVVWDLLSSSPMCSFVHPSGLGLRVSQFSPDASQLMTAGDDGLVCLWDIATRSLKRTLRGGDESAVFAADFTPDGDRIISGTGNGNLYLWDGCHSLHAKHLVQVEEAHDLAVLSCHFNPSTDGFRSINKRYNLVSSGNDGRIRLWRLRISDLNGSCRIDPVKTLECQNQSVMSVRFSGNGKMVAATGGDKLVTLFDTESGNVLHRLDHHQRHVGACAFSKSGSFLATGSNDRTVAVWRIGNQPNPDLFNKNRNFASREESSLKNVMKRKNEATLSQTVACHLSDVNAVVFVDNDQLISCSGDKTIRLWRRHSENDVWEEDDKMSKPLSSCRYGVTSVSFCEKSRFLATAALDGHVTLWDSRDFEKISVFTNPGKSSIRVCQLSPDGHWMLAAGDGDVAHVYDLRTLSHSHTLIGHDATILLACFTSDSSLIVTGCHDGVLKLWLNSGSSQTHSGQENHSRRDNVKALDMVRNAHDMGVTCGECAPFSDVQERTTILVSGGNDSLIKVWKISLIRDTIKLSRALEGHGSSVMSIRFSSDGQLFASTSGDKTTRLWDSDNWTCVRLFEGHSRFVACCAFSPNGHSLATGSNDKLINIWKLSGHLVQPYVSEDMATEDKIDFEDEEESKVPFEFICPITQDIMRYPVRCSDGFVYERAAIQEWLLSRRRTSPMTNLPVSSTSLEPEHELRKAIQEFVENCSRERV